MKKKLIWVPVVLVIAIIIGIGCFTQPPMQKAQRRSDAVLLLC